MGRTYTRLHRLLQLIRVIQARPGLKVADLAASCGVHERTVYRDIDALNASGIPCHFDPGAEGYRIRAGFYMPPVELTLEEAMALVALLEQVAGREQIPFLGVASRAGEKIRSQLPPELLGALEPLDDRVRISLTATMADGGCRDVYELVRRAIADRRVLVCRYEAAGSTTGGAEEREEEFELRPYALWFCQRAWYVVGHHGGRDALRYLKLNRFVAVRPTDRPYPIPDGFDLRADLGLAWRMMRGPVRHEVAVRFEPPFADSAAETRWHPTQREQWEADGRVTLAFTVDGLDEIVWWVMGYGPGATVLRPPELVERVKDLAGRVLARYDGTGTRKNAGRD